jgi:sensor histidine kinase YesM
MKSSVNTIFIHVIVWVLLLLVPFSSTYEVMHSFHGEGIKFSILPILVVSSLLIGLFYLNYFLLIPRFLLPRKYFLYFVVLLGGILLTAILSRSLLFVIGITPEKLEAINPALAIVSPIARANAFLMLIIIIISSILLALNTRLKQTEEEKLSAQLASLKAQINPHFLFNTLNNIYATAIDKSPQTADMVDKLSEMMRYTMSETQHDFVLLEKEINYITNYIEMQKIRLDEKVKLEFTVTGALQEQQIAPMMLVPFVENAFKHGVNAEQQSEIKISINVTGNKLTLDAKNRKVDVQTDTSERSGLGIENTKKRLQHIYPMAHTLVINDTATSFHVSLHVNMQ